jgi:hypothetical protein
MALFKPGSSRVTAAPASDPRFFAFYSPGITVEVSGIYRCICGVEAVSTKGDPLPPIAEHEHSVSTENLLGPPRWHLLVAPERRARQRPADTTSLTGRQLLV